MKSDDGLARLTEREKICLRHWLQHKSAKEIAAELRITHHAVEKRLKMARIKLSATSSLEAARMLSAAEGYGKTVAQTPDLAAHARPTQAVFTRPLIFGAISMSFIGAAVLALVMQPEGETSGRADRTLLVREYDQELDYLLTALIAAAEIGPHGEVFLNRPLGDQRFLEPNSGRYWQIGGAGKEDFASRSLSDRRLKVSGRDAWEGPVYYDSGQFANEPLRIAERMVRLPGSDVDWRFIVARSRDGLD